MKIRLANNSDCDSIVRLIDEVYAEYGDQVLLTGAEQDLVDIESSYFSAGGAFWVLVSADHNQVLGTHGAIGIEGSESRCTFRRLYLAKPFRGTEWGKRLMKHTVDWARTEGFRRIEFWSDTRFTRAHRFFEKFGFQTDGTTRSMTDGSTPYDEYFYFLDL